PKPGKSIFILIDRAVVQPNDEDLQFRIADSVQTAFFEGHSECHVRTTPPPSPPPLKKKGEEVNHVFSDRFELDGIVFEEPNVNFFSFNNSYGACPRCEGFGSVLGIDEDLVIPDKSLTVYEGAIAPWRSDKMNE